MLNKQKRSSSQIRYRKKKQDRRFSRTTPPEKTKACHNHNVCTFIFALFKQFFSVVYNRLNWTSSLFISSCLAYYVYSFVSCMSPFTISPYPVHIKNLLKTNKTHKLIELSFWRWTGEEVNNNKKRGKISLTAFLLHVQSLFLFFLGRLSLVKVTDLLSHRSYRNQERRRGEKKRKTRHRSNYKSTTRWRFLSHKNRNDDDDDVIAWKKYHQQINVP